MVMKKYVYYNHWLKDTAAKEEDIPKYPKDFDNYWKKQSTNNHKAKIVWELVQHYGLQILDKPMLSLAPVLRTSLKDLSKMLELVDANLTDSAKSLLLKSPVTIQAAQIEELESDGQEAISLEKKWLDSSDIDLYLRFFHS